MSKGQEIKDAMRNHQVMLREFEAAASLVEANWEGSGLAEAIRFLLVRRDEARTLLRPNHQAGPEQLEAVHFGPDVFTCPCGGSFHLEVEARFRGFAFNSDGFAFDELDCLDTEALVKCEACGQTYGFGEWQEAATAREQTQQPTA